MINVNGVKIGLRALKSGDDKVMHVWRREPTINRFNPLADLTLAALTAQLAQEGDMLSNEECTSFRWMVEADGEAVGSVAVSGISWRMGYGEIGYLMAESSHGKGYGTAAVMLLINKIFTESTLRRLTATIANENVASWRLVERLGFQREGTLRQHFLIQGRYVDEYYYGLLRSEWAGV